MVKSKISGVVEIHDPYDKEVRQMLKEIWEKQNQLEKILMELLEINQNYDRLQTLTLKSQAEKIKVAVESGRMNWGESKEEVRCKIYEILSEAIELNIPLRTTSMKKAGGKFSSAISYSYRYFDGGWNEAKKNFKLYDGDLDKLKELEREKSEED